MAIIINYMGGFLMRCCFCNRVITPEEGHDAYPLRPETYYGETEENRCCTRCNARIVLPNRLLWGRDLEKIEPHQRRILRKKNYMELLEFSKGVRDRIDQMWPGYLKALQSIAK